MALALYHVYTSVPRPSSGSRIVENDNTLASLLPPSYVHWSINMAKVVVVTGASAGVGRATVEEFAR